MPRGVNGPGTHLATWSGTAFMKSVTATNGPSDADSASVTYGTRGVSVGCSRFHRSAERASSRRALYEVALHRSAATSWFSASSRCASRAAPWAVPLKITVARRLGPSGAAAKRYSPLRIPSSAPSGMVGMA